MRREGMVGHTYQTANVQNSPHQNIAPSKHRGPYQTVNRPKSGGSVYEGPAYASSVYGGSTYGGFAQRSALKTAYGGSAYKGSAYGRFARCSARQSALKNVHIEGLR